MEWRFCFLKKVIFKIHNSKSKFEISIQNQQSKIYEHALTNFELQFVVSEVLPHFSLLSFYARGEKVQC